MRRLRTINRRKYQVPAPLSLWHIDGNHKFIRYVKSSLIPWLPAFEEIIIVIGYRKTAPTWNRVSCVKTTKFEVSKMYASQWRLHFLNAFTINLMHVRSGLHVLSLVLSQFLVIDKITSENQETYM